MTVNLDIESKEIGVSEGLALSARNWADLWIEDVIRYWHMNYGDPPRKRDREIPPCLIQKEPSFSHIRGLPTTKNH
jgi:hypothetical protein